MRRDIVNFIQEIKKKYKLEARYFPSTDVYSLRKNGKGVQNFNTRNFYQLPKTYRKGQIRAIIQMGLNHNLGERTVRDMIHLNQTIGKKL